MLPTAAFLILFLYITITAHFRVSIGAIFILLSMPLKVAFHFIFIIAVHTSHKGTYSVLYELLSISYSMVFF